MTCRFITGILISFSFLLISCEADIDLQKVSNDIKLHPNLVVPLGSLSVNLGDILSNYDTDGKFIESNNEIYFQDFDTTVFKLNNIVLDGNFGFIDQPIFPSPYTDVI